ncbi:hypothetical protein QYE76_048148 [Lolium multiflorum]|uniref:Reverse transcriptase/retrotransposon-derived protein RNase H-like domain-containing protein n=1 Tax=Lolium multiflorum TaxID=4521 RepID=A0AAD8VC32_LOLMU|nr:hypothetical protein QYE76_048148 [Lolium multiflorum]
MGLVKIKSDEEFRWGAEQQQAFDDIKEYLTKPPVLVPPQQDRPFYIYLSVADTSIASVVVQVYDGLEKVVFYLNRRMLDAETRYLEIEKLCLCLFFTYTKIKHILLKAEIIVICKSDVIKHMLSAPVLKGRLGKWMFALSEFDIRYQPAKAVKGQALADLIAERINTDVAALSVRAWTMFFDGSVWNGVAIGRVEAVEIFGDSKLVISQLTEEYKCESELLFPLWMQCRELMAQFSPDECDIEDATELRLWSLEKIKENKAKVARAYNKKVKPKEFQVGDLAAANAAKFPQNGRTIEFGSLRVCFGTVLRRRLSPVLVAPDPPRWLCAGRRRGSVEVMMAGAVNTGKGAVEEGDELLPVSSKDVWSQKKEEKCLRKFTEENAGTTPSRALVAKVFRHGFYWPPLENAEDMEQIISFHNTKSGSRDFRGSSAGIRSFRWHILAFIFLLLAQIILDIFREGDEAHFSVLHDGYAVPPLSGKDRVQIVSAFTHADEGVQIQLRIPGARQREALESAPTTAASTATLGSVSAPFKRSG